MTDKYYTPTIEEFRVGFEYCMMMDDGALSPLVYEIDSPIIDNNSCQLLDYIRVKQLDREDIESLGLIYISKNEYRTVFSIPNTEFELDFYKDRTIYIGNTETYECHKCLFDGKIKNKSELQVLLKQLS